MNETKHPQMNFGPTDLGLDSLPKVKSGPLIVIGTRPEAIKMAPIALELSRRQITATVLSTGQHQEPVYRALADLDVSAYVRQDVDRENGHLSDLYANLLRNISTEVRNLKPSVVLVQGDTMSALAGAHASFLLGTPIGHVEAGLRTASIKEPFPEEANRRMISQLADYHFAPTAATAALLAKEGHSNVLLTGNTVIDALQRTAGRIDAQALRTSDAQTLLVTLHRRESWERGIRTISQAIKTFLSESPTWTCRFITHPNPAVQHTVKSILGTHPRVTIEADLGYIDFCSAMAGADLILTDSGGVQEEAPSLNVPVLVARNVTERIEGVAAGCLALCGTSYDGVLHSLRIYSDVTGLRYKAMASAPNPYGDGLASRRIVDFLTARALAKSNDLSA